MTEARSVSVVIPVGRVDEDLPLQLEALSAQSYSGPWELVLSLNNNDVAERQALERLVEQHRSDDAAFTAEIVDSSDTRSASHARNVGAAAATGDLLLFCDGDDIADEDWMVRLIEALAAGLPLVGFDNAYVRDLVGDSDAGLFVPRGDTDALQQALQSLAEDPDRLAAMAQAARKVAGPLNDEDVFRHRSDIIKEAL